jgi:transcriptional regulator with XRE-family HTH domain
MAQKKTSKKNATSKEYDLRERLRYLRELKHLTQKQLADLADVSQATIAHIEKSTKDPSVETLRKLSEALDIHVATLFSNDDVYVFDLKRLRRKYTSADNLTPHLYMALGRIVQYAKDIGYIK